MTKYNGIYSVIPQEPAGSYFKSREMTEHIAYTTKLFTKYLFLCSSGTVV